MVLEKEDGVVLSGKTGMGIERDETTKEVKLLNSYFVGYVEKEGNTYFYATNIETDREDGHKAKDITLKILKDKGLLPSKAATDKSTTSSGSTTSGTATTSSTSNVNRRQ